MNRPEHVWHPDWWSRLMAIGSLLVAGAALWYASVELPKLSTGGVDDAQVATLLTQLQQEANASAERETRFKQVISRLELLDTSGESGEQLLAGSDRTAAAPSNLLEEPAAEDNLSQTAAENSDLSNSGADPGGDAESVMAGSAETSGDLELYGYQGPDGDETDQETSALFVVRTSLRPLKEDHAASVVLENVSTEPAVISKLTFDPIDVIEGISTELAIKPLGESSDSELVLVFESRDNLARTPGQQGRYARRMLETYTIPAGEQIELHLAIKNPEHLGYGVLGDLTLEFNTTESKRIPNVALAFVGRPTSESNDE